MYKVGIATTLRQRWNKKGVLIFTEPVMFMLTSAWTCDIDDVIVIVGLYVWMRGELNANTKSVLPISL